MQYRDLKFFAEVVAPHLGSSHGMLEGDAPQWQSFMTDDGTPLELSWDWGTSDKSPIIRYSIEPIGQHAGTLLDLRNLKVGPAFQNQLGRALPDMRLDWFYHFDKFFNTRTEKDTELDKDVKDHNTSIFYAFDLSESKVTAKTYFFPKYRAQIHGQSRLEVLSQAIQSAPYVTGDNLEAWSVAHDFFSDTGNVGLEHEMLAIDHIDPLKSRIKVYFRSRETSFKSVISVMTLGGRITNPKVYQGLDDLARLWRALFGDGIPLDQPLSEVGHLQRI
ncbi:hypothetical protein VSDG_08679 [Cytospora chrysosperma]|uniref:Aromatic prenyltransferase (DMATS family) n=1 Tax=Cytospora chrysosperma TaxID=252740 RepID=A0A423VEL0_CYTCH|nr:hypothetical protein VSDG_08679 [Valsa sordida]